ncbi:MAG: hypothetical protein SFZ03_08220 [Candidatus Melainabacteria bacterium]|nr:hypothetical protein [Candidatus Melainabacteria bacterium]
MSLSAVWSLFTKSCGLVLAEDHLTIFSKYLLARLLLEAPEEITPVLFLEHISEEIEGFVQDYLADKPLFWPLHYYLWIHLNIESLSARKRVLAGLLEILRVAKLKQVPVYGLPTFDPSLCDSGAESLHAAWHGKITDRLTRHSGAPLILIGRLHASSQQSLFGTSLNHLLAIPAVGIEPVTTAIQPVLLHRSALVADTAHSMALAIPATVPNMAIFDEDWVLHYPQALDNSPEQCSQVVENLALFEQAEGNSRY